VLHLGGIRSPLDGAGGYRGGAAQVKDRQSWGIAVAFLVGGALGAAFTYVIVIHFAKL
jgi:hypothetical protein